MTFLILHDNDLSRACMSLLADQPWSQVQTTIMDPRSASNFKSAIRMFKRWGVTYYLGAEPEARKFDYVVACGDEWPESKAVKGERITPEELAKMFPGVWADAILRQIPEEVLVG